MEDGERKRNGDHEFKTRQVKISAPLAREKKKQNKGGPEATRWKFRNVEKNKKR